MAVSVDSPGEPVHRFCPYLASVDEEGGQTPALDYPSFENRCFAVTSQQSVILSHQATFCLGSSHGLCPRHQALGPVGLRGRNAEGFPGERTGDFLADSGLVDPASLDEPERPSLLWLWAGVALAAFLVLGGTVAAYAGWQLATQGGLLAGAEEGPQLTSSISVLPPENPSFILVTATPTLILLQPESGLVNPGGAESPPRQESDQTASTFAFPQAVTPTPTIEGFGTSGEGAAQPMVISTPTSAVGGNLGEQIPLAPTRRPTPTFSIPTSTPISEQSPTPGEVARIEFRVAHQSLPAGSCTIFSWDVANVRAVFFADQGVDGKGEARACMDDTPIIRTLSVLHLDGREESRTLTVNLIIPTQTPTQTPTFTPVLTPTPTWTPEGTPATTPVPEVQGVTLVVEGGNQRTCTAGELCIIYLGMSNLGSVADELFLVIVAGGGWPAQLCRQDGLCAESVISLGVAVGQVALLEFRLTPPADAAGQELAFTLQGESGRSQRAIKSEPVSVVVTAN